MKSVVHVEHRCLMCGKLEPQHPLGHRGQYIREWVDEPRFQGAVAQLPTEFSRTNLNRILSGAPTRGEEL